MHRCELFRGGVGNLFSLCNKEADDIIEPYLMKAKRRGGKSFPQKGTTARIKTAKAGSSGSPLTSRPVSINISGALRNQKPAGQAVTEFPPLPEVAAPMAALLANECSPAHQVHPANHSMALLHPPAFFSPCSSANQYNRICPAFVPQPITILLEKTIGPARADLLREGFLKKLLILNGCRVGTIAQALTNGERKGENGGGGEKK